MPLDLMMLRTDRMKRSVSQQLSLCLGAFLNTAALFLTLGIIYGLVELIADEQPWSNVAPHILAASLWFLGCWLGLLAAFVGRGVALGLAENPIAGERRAGQVTLVALSIGAVILFSLVGTARADEMAPASPRPGPTADYCGRDLGTWFYCVRPDPQPEADAKPAPPATPAASEEERQLAEFEKFKVDLDRAEKLAVWSPTQENIEKFYRLQRAALNQSSLFSDEYRRLVWVRPDLDYSLKRPVSELGKRQWADQRSNDRDLFLRKIAGEVGLFYVYREACGACRVFSPVMREFANRYSLTVKGISTDGSDNPYIAEKMIDRGQLHAWGFDNPTTPSILLFQSSNVDARGEVHPLYVRLSDNRTVKVNPCMKPQGCLSYLGAGVMAQDDIVERIYVLLATEPGQDY